jgi:hypothetical protein
MGCRSKPWCWCYQSLSMVLFCTASHRGNANAVHFVFIGLLTRMTSIIDLPLDRYVMMNANLKLDEMRWSRQRTERPLLLDGTGHANNNTHCSARRVKAKFNIQFTLWSRHWVCYLQTCGYNWIPILSRHTILNGYKSHARLRIWKPQRLEK